MTKMLFVVLALLLPGTSFAQDSLDIAAVVKESLRESTSAGHVVQAVWLPEELFILSNPGMSSEQKEALANAFSEYLLVGIAHGTIGPLGGVSWTQESLIRAGARLLDRQRNSYVPLPSRDVAPDVRNLLLVLRPLWIDMLGPIGENIHFLAFPGRSKDGQRIANARESGAFSVLVAQRELTWRLPLSALLPAKTCPIDGEKLSGAWSFCPWHGAALAK